MTDQRSIVVTRWDRASSLERDELTRLLTDYHLQTETEKRVPVASADALPAKYRAELTDPLAAFDRDEVLIARYEGDVAGCLVITSRDDRRLEVKRLWTDPGFRGRRVAGSLLVAAHAHAVHAGAEAIQLSVWEWRQDAIALYRKFGFVETPSWEEREHLICMSFRCSPPTATA